MSKFYHILWVAALVVSYEDFVLDDTTSFAAYTGPPLLHGRGASTAAIIFRDSSPSTSPNDGLLILQHHYVSGSTSEWTITTNRLLPADYDISMSFGGYFGYNHFHGIGIAGDVDKDTIVAVGAIDDNSARGAAYIFQGSWKSWTEQQKLIRPDGYNANDYFGASVEIDQVTNEILMVGSNGGSVSSVYIYHGNKEGNSWSSVQRLQIEDEPIDRLGRASSIYGDTFISTARQTSSPFTWYTTIFTKAPGKKPWSYQQVLRGDNSIIQLSIHRDTIITSDTSYNSNEGRVLVYLPSFTRYADDNADSRRLYSSRSLVGKPPPQAKWSLQQQLVSDVPRASDYFGQNAEINHNTIVAVIASVPNSNHVLVFTRPSYYSPFTLQQKLTQSSSHFANVLGATMISADTFFPKFHTQTSNWSCLMFALSDQFGDGWDGARLLIEAPDGTSDAYASRCDTPNPFYFRYCPYLPTDTGLYKISIIDAESAKYPWEILYRVKNEATGEWFSGDQHTKMDFHFQNLTFYPRKMEHLMHNTSSCIACKPKPSPKAKTKPPPHRQLADTASPTMAQSEVDYWQYLVLSTNDLADVWYFNDLTTTSYYISDISGKKLHKVGTKCNDTVFSESCWQVLPDGDYILRVGGALNDDSSSIDWNFCGIAGGAQEEMIFRVSDGECTAFSKVTRSQYCTDTVGLIAVGKGVVLVSGATMYASLDEVSAGDKALLIKAIATAFSFDEADVRLIDLDDYGDGVAYSFTLKVRDYSSSEIISAVEYINGLSVTLSEHSGDLLAALSTGLGVEGSSLIHATSIELLSFEYYETIFDYPEVSIATPEIVVPASDDDVPNFPQDETGSLLVREEVGYPLAVLGYAGLAAVVGMAIMAVVKHRSKRAGALRRQLLEQQQEEKEEYPTSWSERKETTTPEQVSQYVHQASTSARRTFINKLDAAAEEVAVLLGIELEKGEEQEESSI